MKWKMFHRKCLVMMLALVLLFSGTGGSIKKAEAAVMVIEISTKSELTKIGNDASYPLDGNYLLKSDIDLDGVNWTPIGNFTGTFDGNSKVISNFAITDTTTLNKGFFSSICAGGSVINLGIERANITGGDNTGILAGSNAGAISRCYTKGIVTGNLNVGGLIGSNTGTIDNSFASASVSGKDYYGGLVGSNSGTVQNSYSSSTVAVAGFNNYLQFDGDDFVYIKHIAAYESDSFTLEAWFQWDLANRMDIDQNLGVNFIISKGFEQYEIHTEGASGKNGMRFIPVPDSDSSSIRYPDSSYIDVHNVLQSGWFHVAAVYAYDEAAKVATVQVYINGEPKDLYVIRSNNYNGTTATLRRDTNPLKDNKFPIIIGARTSTSGPFDPANPTVNVPTDYRFHGKISDVRFYDTARNEEQINDDKSKQLTDAEITAEESEGLVGYWKLNETDGDAIDSVSHNDGKLFGTIGRVSESESVNIGGLIGANTDPGSVTNSYYDSSVTGAANNSIGATANIKDQATFTDWNFDYIWAIDSQVNDGYPYLIPVSMVSFDSDGGSAVADITGVDYDTSIAEPAAPTNTGYTFDGWYKESGLSTPWNFASDTVTSATTLYAKWAHVHSTGGGSNTTNPQSNVTVVFTDQESGGDIDNTNDVKASVSFGSDGSETVTMNSHEVLLLKQPDGTRNPLSDYSNVTFSTASSSNVSLSQDGTIQVQNLIRGGDYTYEVTYNIGGQEITIASMHISVSSSGEVIISIDLIDPYGTITDSSTGKTIEGANVTLYYADTERNKAAGKTPGTIVELPSIDGFKPNNNKNPQISDAGGSFGFMVFPYTDYYIVAAKDGYYEYTSPIISVEKELVKWDFSMNQQLSGVNRISGENRVDTAINIAKAAYSGKLSSVVLVDAEDYYDSLSGSVLAYKLKAPILMIGNSAEDRDKVLVYMKENMDSNGTAYILGGTDTVSGDIEERIKESGFLNIIRLGGADRYETSAEIANETGIKPGTPIIIATGENYPDAISVSSVAAQYQYPILLAGKDGLADSVKKEISMINPKKIFIIGLQGAVSTVLENEVLKAASINKSDIIRIGGADRFETSLEILKYFGLNGGIICAATGNDFSDAIAGSIFAANHNSPMILCDKTLSDNVLEYLKIIKVSNVTMFGGEYAVSDEIAQQFSKILGQELK